MKIVKRHRGRFRVEFLACLPEIKDFVNKGYTKSMIYDDLQANKRITVSYSQFCRYMEAEFSHNPRQEQEKRNLAPALALPTTKQTENFPAIIDKKNHTPRQEGSNAITQVAATTHNLVK